MKPNFICVGFPKCGTTTLQEVLKMHKDIYLPDVKEAGYFVDSIEYKRGLSWYEKRYYAKVKNEKIIGEINGGLTGGFYARNICRDLGRDIKVVFIMRNPVDRLYSHFKFKERIGYQMLRHEYTGLSESRKFDIFLEENMKYSQKYGSWDILISNQKYIFEQGKYSEYIEEYFSYLKPENIHCIIFEEYIRDPEKAYEKLFTFLGIEMDKNIDYGKKANEGKRQPRNEIFMLANELATDMWINHLRSRSKAAAKFDNQVLMIRDLLWNLFSKPVREKTNMSDRAEAILKDYYQDDIKKLEKLLNKDLSGLWYE